MVWGRGRGGGVLYVRARTVLLDAVDAPTEQRDVLALVGAQAIYLHTGRADFRCCGVRHRRSVGRGRGGPRVEPRGHRALAPDPATAQVGPLPSVVLPSTACVRLPPTPDPKPDQNLPAHRSPSPVPPSGWLPLGQALADVVEHGLLCHLKDKRDIGHAWRFLNALFGGVAFYASVLFQQYRRSQALASQIDQLRAQAGSSLQAERQLALIAPLNDPNAIFYYYISAIVLAAIVAPLIAWGIRRGGPLRIFFAGVTVPALVFFVANRVFG